MNRERRKALHKVVERLEQCQSEVEELRGEIEDIIAEEQEAYDNMPEGFQNGDRGQEMQEYIDTMESAASDLDNADLSDIIESLGEIAM